MEKLLGQNWYSCHLKPTLEPGKSPKTSRKSISHACSNSSNIQVSDSSRIFNFAMCYTTPFPPPDWSTNHCGNVLKMGRYGIIIKGEIRIISPYGYFEYPFSSFDFANFIRTNLQKENTEYNNYNCQCPNHHTAQNWSFV